MNRNFKTSSITEAAMISGILVIFAYLSSLLFSGLMFFYPLPALILAKRKGLRYAVTSLTASGIIISMLLGINTGISFIVLFTPLAVFLSYGICRDMDANRSIMLGAVAFMISFVLMLLIYQFIMGVNYIHQLIEITNESVNIYKDMLNSRQGGLDAAKLEELIKEIDTQGSMIVDFISRFFPAMLISFSVMVSAANYFAASKLSGRLKVVIRKHEGISNFSFPKTFVIAIAALLIISYLLSAFNINVNIIQLNLFMICFMAMFLQGFAVLKFFLMKLRLNKAMRAFILIMSLFVAGAGPVLAMVGMADLIFDLRKIKHKIV